MNFYTQSAFDYDRNIIVQSYAIINYFQLLEKCFLCNNNADSFYLIGGEDNIRILIENVQSGKLDIFSSSKEELIEQLSNNVQIMSSIKFSQDKLTEKCITTAQIVLNKYKYWTDSSSLDIHNNHENAYSSIYLPTGEEKISELSKLKSLSTK